MAGRRKLLRGLLVAALWFSAPSTVAAEGWLDAPVACEVGVTCWPLQHFDHDPGPGALDFGCGDQAYDGHKGVDIGLASEAEIAGDVAVLAAADGKVTAVRDGEIDGVVLREGLSALPQGRDCGNGVLIDHGDGWRTQYCHLRAGSVAVQPGEHVSRGTRLGAIGLSGRTQFAHLHFSVRRDNEPVDPYAPDGFDPERCAATKGALWTDEAARALAYAPFSLVAVGLIGEEPSLRDAAAGAYRRPTIERNAPALMAWALAWHVKSGDKAMFEIVDPHGRNLLMREVTIARDRLRQMLYVGVRANGPWPAGLYTANVSFARGDGSAQKHSFTVEVQ